MDDPRSDYWGSHPMEPQSKPTPPQPNATPKTEEPKHLPFEITGVSAPLAYEAPYLYNLDRRDRKTSEMMDSTIAISGRHVRPDGTRGPEVIIKPHAFKGIDRDTILDHAHEMIMFPREKRLNPNHKVSGDNILHKTWYEGGDMTQPPTLHVDPTQVETQEDYNARIKELGF